MIPALLVIVLSSTAFSEPTTTEPDWQAELLQRILRLVEPVHAADLIEGDARIEVQYPDSHSHVKCGTILTSEINASWARLSKETQVRLTRLFQRQGREAELVLNCESKRKLLYSARKLVCPRSHSEEDQRYGPGRPRHRSQRQGSRDALKLDARR